MKNLLPFIFICLFSACGLVEDENMVTGETAPEEFSWSSSDYMINRQTIIRDSTLSDKELSHLDTVDNFSIGYKCEARHLYTRKVSKVWARAKYYFPQPGKASFVCSVYKDGKEAFWQALPLDTSAVIKQWASNEVTFDLGQTFGGDEVISVYIWSPDRDELFIEDLNVKAIK